MYLWMAWTAQTERLDGAMKSEQPWGYWWVLEAFNCKYKEPSDVKEMSPWLRWMSALHCIVEGEVNSLEQRKPQKANLNADHSMRLSGGRTSGAFANSVMTWWRSDIVIGRQHIEVVPTVPLMPHRRRWNKGLSWKESSKPFSMWAKWMPAMYNLMVL